jgi:hypothetical protein
MDRRHRSSPRSRALVASDLSLLPSDLAARSLSKENIVLLAADAVQAIDHLAAGGSRIEAWEGVVVMAEGGRAQSLEHPGSFVLPGDAAKSAARAREQIQHAQERWDRRPEYPGATNYYRLTVGHG